MPPRGVSLRPLGLPRNPLGALLVLPTATPAELRRLHKSLRGLTRSNLRIAVDGGYNVCRKANWTPELFVGDGDSVGRMPNAIPSVLFPRDKDFSDLAGALREAARRGAQLAGVAGLLGGRLDHEWANLQELGRSARPFRAILARTPRGDLAVTAHGLRAESQPGRGFSVLPLNGSATLSLRGARWPLREERLPPGSRGLSNEFKSRRLELRVHRGVAAVVFP